MVNLKYYTAYGLQIASELPLPELVASSAQTSDVHIRYGSVPTALPNSHQFDGFFQAVPGTLLLTVPEVARFLVVEGREVWIERELNSEDADVRIFLLGSVLGALLHLRHILALHASSIHTPYGAVLFGGPSGNGKSTLLGAFLHRGYTMLADDVTAVTLDGTGGPMAIPAFPRLRLWADAAAKFEYRIEGLPRVWGLRDKYVMPAPRFFGQPLPIHVLYSLNVDDSPTIKIEPVEGMCRFQILSANTYRAYFLHGLGLSETHFRLLAPLLKTLNIRRITRPASPFLLAELVDQIEEDLKIAGSSPKMVGTA
jgi:hypothetical protein